mmetsp:Transcript_27061/g.83081  ORF Transcript_27061/g.83081 Transcript_27061/m.83081 type:complete len:313 (-) Transcript_27061:361-1299(-)
MLWSSSLWGRALRGGTHQRQRAVVVTLVLVAVALETRRRRKRRRPDYLAEKLTVILCTSPVKTNPSTALIEETVGSLRHFAPALAACPCVVVCDGYKIRKENRFRSGQVTVESGERYEEFLRRLLKLKLGRVVRCDERLGFGFALKRALTFVKTPYVLVVQHDRNLVRSVDFEKIVRQFDAQPWLKYLGLPTTTTLNYPRFVLSKYAIKVEPVRLLPDLAVVPLLQWYDSTHVASTDHYRHFVYRGDLVKKGGFVEDKLGQHQLADIRSRGFREAHPSYGTFVLDDGADRPMVSHLDGHDGLAYRKFKFASP